MFVGRLRQSVRIQGSLGLHVLPARHHYLERTKTSITTTTNNKNKCINRKHQYLSRFKVYHTETQAAYIFLVNLYANANHKNDAGNLVWTLEWSNQAGLLVMIIRVNIIPREQRKTFFLREQCPKNAEIGRAFSQGVVTHC